MTADAVFAMVAVFVLFGAFAMALCKSAAEGDQMVRRAVRQERETANRLRARTGLVDPAPRAFSFPTNRGSGASTPSRTDKGA